MSGSSGKVSPIMSLRSKPLTEIGSRWICQPFVGGLGDSGLAHSLSQRCRFAPNRLQRLELVRSVSPPSTGSARKPAVPSNRPLRSNRNYFFASSSSIFLLAGSSLLMRKLRIWPAEDASGLAAVGEAPLFQRDCSMELSEDRSAGF